jgi:hypothetical protein
MENNRAVKVYVTRSEWTRKTGRPELRCEDGVIQDIRQSPGSKVLEDVARNTEDWLKLLEKARVHTTQSRQ